MELTLAAARERFKFQECIEKAQSKEIIKVTDSHTGRFYVWKLRQCGLQEVAKARVELDTQLRLSHKFILKLEFWVAEAEAHYFTLVLITPYTGSDLNEQLKSHVLDRCYWSEEELVRLLAQVLSALLYCQTMGVAHRDIKPSNIFLTSKGEVSLGDFGEAKDVESLVQSVRGTVLYLCPIKLEAYRSDSLQRYDPFKSDVYSLGVTFWQLAGLKSEKELEDFRAQSDVWTYMRELQPRYSAHFVGFLGGMVTLDESTRPNFLTLAKHFWNDWPNYRILFPGDMVREDCQHCARYEASEFCLCQFPLVSRCDFCSKEHVDTERGEHEVHALCFRSRFDTQESVSRRLRTSKLLTASIEGLFKARDILRAEREQQTAAFLELQKQVNDTKTAIQLHLDDTERTITSLIAKFKEDLDTVQVKSSEYLDRLQSIEEPYVRIKYLRSGAMECPVVGGGLAALQALDREIVVPVLTGQLALLYSKSRTDTFPLQSCLAEDTSLAMLSSSLLAGYGGAQKPCMLFLLDLNYRKEDRAEGLVGRQGAGLVAVDNILYIFGGKGELSAETWDMDSRRNERIPSMYVEKYRCSPCEYKRKIYLPGRTIDIYDINTSTYTRFASHSLVPSFYLAYIHHDTLFLCTNKAVLSTPITAVCLRSEALSREWNWQAPAVQVGAKLYFVQQGKVREWSFPGYSQSSEEG